MKCNYCKVRCDKKKVGRFAEVWDGGPPGTFTPVWVTHNVYNCTECDFGFYNHKEAKSIDKQIAKTMRWRQFPLDFVVFGGCIVILMMFMLLKYFSIL